MAGSSPIIIDADSHLAEDFDRLHRLTDKRYRSYAPRVVSHGPAEVVYIGSVYQGQAPGMTWGDTNSRGGLDAGNRRMRKWAESEKIGFDPTARLAIMDEHGVRGSVIFPSAGLSVATIKDAEIGAAVCRGVNRYVAEFCSADSSRLWPAATVPLIDAELAAAEARYAVEELGAKCVFAPSGVHGPEPLYHHYYDPLFDTMEELGVPYCTHAGGAAMRGGLGVDRFPGVFPSYHMTTHTIEAMISSLGVLTHGVLERRPGLKMGFFEAGTGWIAFWLEKMEEKFEHLGWMMPDLTRSPLETFKRQCVVTVEAHEIMLAPTLEFLDGAGVLWSSDLPHFDCEDGGSPARLVADTKLTDDHKRRVLGANAIEFFGLDVTVPA